MMKEINNEVINNEVMNKETEVEEATACPWYSDLMGCFLCPCAGMCADEEC